MAGNDDANEGFEGAIPAFTVAGLGLARALRREAPQSPTKHLKDPEDL